jgi:uncharacterized protein YjbI with pentapeptide repeats
MQPIPADEYANTPKSRAEAWYNTLDKTEKRIFRLSSVAVLIVLAVYIIANFDVLGVVRVVNDFADNIITDIISVAVTIVVLQRWNQRQSTIQRQEDLILQLGSEEGAFVREAVRHLRRYGWLIDGTLDQGYFRSANLAAALLKHASLQDSDLGRANLKNADIAFANLQEADLSFADLEGAELSSCKLQGANLSYANLRHSLGIDTATFDTNTILPNGDQWHDGYDLTIFSNPDHPNFWEPAELSLEIVGNLILSSFNMLSFINNVMRHMQIIAHHHGLDMGGNDGDSRVFASKLCNRR